ncbi:unnamed protein product [Hymenolepis diminuta]|uniref:Uncharacterized protein n=1 Tax=Hymenolepis diminuta TaxID=6216 RepID=A0A0R3SFV4_HYMDI|nr:unnamed protein product [Hymenolepis diminuta]
MALLIAPLPSQQNELFAEDNEVESELNRGKDDDLSSRKSETIKPTESNSEAGGQQSIDTEIEVSRASEKSVQGIPEVKKKSSLSKQSNSRNSNNSKLTSRRTSKLSLKKTM